MFSFQICSRLATQDGGLNSCMEQLSECSIEIQRRKSYLAKPAMSRWHAALVRPRIVLLVTSTTTDDTLYERACNRAMQHMRVHSPYVMCTKTAVTRDECAYGRGRTRRGRGLAYTVAYICTKLQRQTYVHLPTYIRRLPRKSRIHVWFIITSDICITTLKSQHFCTRRILIIVQ